jgi:lipoate-protein ligase A
LQALNALDVPAVMNERYDLILQGKKISGSAFRETRQNCFHHGTLLIDADLPMLREVLAPSARQITTHAVRSVRSSVMNLRDFDPALSVERIQSQIITAFATHHRIPDASMLLGQETLASAIVQTELNLYQSPEWLYHKTLPFEEQRQVGGQSVRLTVEDGFIKNIDPALPELNALLGTMFE